VGRVLELGATPLAVTRRTEQFPEALDTNHVRQRAHGGVNRKPMMQIDRVSLDGWLRLDLVVTAGLKVGRPEKLHLRR
jgi:hypothetical protein